MAKSRMGGISQVINEVMHGRSAYGCDCIDIVGDYYKEKHVVGVNAKLPCNKRNPEPGDAGVLQSSEVQITIPRYPTQFLEASQQIKKKSHSTI